MQGAQRGQQPEGVTPDEQTSRPCEAVAAILQSREKLIDQRKCQPAEQGDGEVPGEEMQHVSFQYLGFGGQFKGKQIGQPRSVQSQ